MALAHLEEIKESNGGMGLDGSWSSGSMYWPLSGMVQRGAKGRR